MIQHHYNLAPNIPYTPPNMALPAAAPCGPGAKFPQGRYIGRGGVFQGPAMAAGDSHCGYWSDYVGEVPLKQVAWGHPVGRHPASVALAPVPEWPPQNRVGFMPRRVFTGPQLPRGTSGFGTSAGPGPWAPGPQYQNPMAMIIDRTRRVWRGPSGTQEQWPSDMTPRGGTLDGNTLSISGQSAYSAFYEGDSPKVLHPQDRINVWRNPLHQQPVPQVGWGLQGYGATPMDYARRAMRALPRAMQPAGMGEYFNPITTDTQRITWGTAEEARRPELIRRGGSEVATRPTALAHRAQPARQPRAITAAQVPLQSTVFPTATRLEAIPDMPGGSRAGTLAGRQGVFGPPQASCPSLGAPDGLMGFGA